MKFRLTRCLTALAFAFTSTIAADNNGQEIKSNLPALTAKFTTQEVQVLELLSQRREELAKKAEELKIREIMMLALEKNINAKLADLEALNKMCQKAKLEMQAIEDAKTKSLVKIYENMHPRRAAQIFDEMDMGSLVTLVSAMKEIKVAAIIASMNVKKAKELSICLTKKALPADAPK